MLTNLLLGEESAINRLLASTAVFVVVLGTVAPARGAKSFDEIIDLTTPWLFIGTGSPNDGWTLENKFSKGVGNAVAISNIEIGANKAPMPSTSAYNIPGLDVNTNLPEVPGHHTNDPDGAGTMAFGARLGDGQIITNSGQVGITFDDRDKTSNNGRFSVSNVGVFAKNVADGGPVPNNLDPGIVTAGKANTNTSGDGTIAGNSNSAFNDPGYRNAIGDPTMVSEGDIATGKVLGPDNGITGMHDFSELRSALDDALDLISTLTGDNDPISAKLEIDDDDTLIDMLDGSTIDLSSDGLIKGDSTDKPTTLYVKADHGLNVIDFDTGGNDLKMENGNIIIDGFEDSFVIFRVPDDAKFNINQGTIHVTNPEEDGMGIGLWNVMFFSARTETSTVFSFDDTIFNGIAFWTLGDGSGSHVNNSQGCVQYVGDKLNFQNIRYNGCHEDDATTTPAIPLPPSAWMALPLLGGMAVIKGMKTNTDRSDVARPQGVANLGKRSMTPSRKTGPEFQEGVTI